MKKFMKKLSVVCCYMPSGRCSPEAEAEVSVPALFFRAPPFPFCCDLRVLGRRCGFCCEASGLLRHRREYHGFVGRPVFRERGLVYVILRQHICHPHRYAARALKLHQHHARLKQAFAVGFRSERDVVVPAEDVLVESDPEVLSSVDSACALLQPEGFPVVA